jgi:DNA-binding GntR family transcriptional regulator
VQQRGSRAIVDAIDAGDADRAADACVNLLREQGDLVIKLLASRGMFGTES